jgi:predicted  nucleic acid-binding Zn ribbon protein
MSTAGIASNPIHCLKCNRERRPESLELSSDLVDAIADWYRTYGAIDALELASGAYEDWARSQLLDPKSEPNVDGLEISHRVNASHRCYFWFWQPDSDQDFTPRTTCPFCERPLVAYEEGIFPQLVCEPCGVVVVGR